MTAVISQKLFQLGAVGAPSMSFIGDTNTGIFSPSADRLDLSAGGTSRLFVSAFQVGVTAPVRGPDGAVGAPQYTFTSDSTTGMYVVSSGILAFATGGTERLRASSTGVTATVPVTGTAVVASGLTGAVSATRYVGGTTSAAPTTGTFVLGDWVVAQDGTVWVCTTAGSPGTWTRTSDVIPRKVLTLATDISGGISKPHWWSPTFVAASTKVVLEFSISAYITGQAWGWLQAAVGIPGASGYIEKAQSPYSTYGDATLIGSIIDVGQLAPEDGSSCTRSVLVTGLTVGTTYTIENLISIVGGAAAYVENQAISDICLSGDESLIVTVGYYDQAVCVHSTPAHTYANSYDGPQSLRRTGRIELPSTAFPYAVAMDPTATTGNGTRGVAIDALGIYIFDVDYMAYVSFTAKPGAMGAGVPQNVAWRAGSTKVYVTDNVGGVYSFDTSTSTWGSKISVGGASDVLSYIDINPAGTKAWVSNQTAGAVRSINLPAETVNTAVTVGGGSTSAPKQNQAMSDGSVWVACSGTNNLCRVLDGSGVTKTVAATHNKPICLAATSDGGLIYYLMEPTAGSGSVLFSYFIPNDTPTVPYVEDGTLVASHTTVPVSMCLTQGEAHLVEGYDTTLFINPQGLFVCKAATHYPIPFMQYAEIIVHGGV